MWHELRRQPAYGLTIELAFKLGVGTPREIDRNLHLRFIHRQHEAITANAGLRAERCAQQLARTGLVAAGRICEVVGILPRLAAILVLAVLVGCSSGPGENASVTTPFGISITRSGVRASALRR